MTRGLAVAGAVLVLAAAPAAASPGAVTVSVDRTQVSTRLGKTFQFHTRIDNNGTAPVAGLVAHLNVLSLRAGVYVDPEDWSSHRARYLASIPPGGSTTLTWWLKSVNAGRIGVYVAVLPGNGTPVRPTTGPTLRVSIADRKSLNSGGIVPLAVGVPALIGLFLLAVRLRRSRRLSL
jgi:hypothetical protein